MWDFLQYLCEIFFNSSVNFFMHIYIRFLLYLCEIFFNIYVRFSSILMWNFLQYLCEIFFNIYVRFSSILMWDFLQYLCEIFFNIYVKFELYRLKSIICMEAGRVIFYILMSPLFLICVIPVSQWVVYGLFWSRFIM